MPTGVGPRPPDDRGFERQVGAGPLEVQMHFDWTRESKVLTEFSFEKKMEESVVDSRL